MIALASSITYAVQAKMQGSPNAQLSLGISLQQEMAYSHGMSMRAVKYLRILQEHVSLIATAPSGGSISSGRTHLYQPMWSPVCFIETGIEDLPPAQADPVHTSIFAPFPNQLLARPSLARELEAAGWDLLDEGMQLGVQQLEQLCPVCGHRL